MEGYGRQMKRHPLQKPLRRRPQNRTLKKGEKAHKNPLKRGTPIQKNWGGWRKQKTPPRKNLGKKSGATRRPTKKTPLFRGDKLPTF